MIDTPRFNNPLRIAVALSILVTAAIFALSLHDALHYPGVDLRNRIVGARLMHAHLNPYPDPGPFQPIERYRMFKLNTGSPALLAFYAPLCGLPYATARLLLFAFDWICIAFMFWQTRSWLPQTSLALASRNRAIHSVLFTLLLIADFALRLNIGEGQYYLIVAALVTTAISSWRAPDGTRGWIGALALSLLLLLRPISLIVFPILWLQGCGKQAMRAAVISAVFAGLMLAAFGAQPWAGYFAMARGLMQREASIIFTQAVPSASTTEAPPVDTGTIPYWKVEGQDFSQMFRSNYAVTRAPVSFCAIQQTIRPSCGRLFRTAGIISRVNTSLLALTALYCLLIAYRLRNSTTDLKLGFAFLAPILLETFGPAKYAYADVTLAPVLLLILAILLPQHDWRQLRHGAALVLALCALSSLGPYVLSSTAKPIIVLSLSRWIVLLFFANAVFLKAALHPRASPVPAVSTVSA